MILKNLKHFILIICFTYSIQAFCQVKHQNKDDIYYVSSFELQDGYTDFSQIYCVELLIDNTTGSSAFMNGLVKKCINLKQLSLKYGEGTVDFFEKDVTNLIGSLPKLTFVNIQIDSVDVFPKLIPGNSNLEKIAIYTRYTNLWPTDMLGLAGIKSCEIRSEYSVRNEIDWSTSTRLTNLVLDMKGPISAPDISKNLTLEKITFTNDQISELPDYFFKSTTIEKLHINLSNLTKIDDELGNMSQLKELKIISKGPIKELPNNLHLTNLDVFALELNQYFELPDLSESTKLRSISIKSANKIGKLPELLNRSKNLDFLFLDLPALNTIPLEINQLTKLRYLEILSVYPLAGIQSISDLTAIETLSLWGIDIVDVTSIAEKNNNLKQLTLSAESLHSKDFNQIKSLKDNKNLKIYLTPKYYAFNDETKSIEIYELEDNQLFETFKQIQDLLPKKVFINL